MNFQNLLGNILSFYSQGKYSSEVAVAQKEFIKWVGGFDRDSSEIEEKIEQFTDWYIFKRSIAGLGLTPVYAAEKEEGLRSLIEKDRKIYESLCLSKASLFLLKKIKNKDIYIEDIFSSYTVVIRGSDIAYGIDKGQIFECRLIPYEDNYFLGNYFCFHPIDATKYILSTVKKSKFKCLERREEFIKRLFKLRHLASYYRHIKINQIYSDGDRLRM